MKFSLCYSMFAFLQSNLLLSLITSAHGKKAILGVDLGSLYMKVALVQRNSPLQIVTNMHSKRKTEQLVLFDDGARFYGADASSLIARKPHLTPAVMTVMLGRHHDHPTVKVLSERHYPLFPTFNETRSGVMLTVDGVQFTPEELVAMVLTHARDISAIYGDMAASTMIRDVVLTVPSFYTIHERRALLDAATLADLNVLAMIDENTAAALHYGMDRIEPEPKYALFYNMGASATQVSVVKFFSYEHKDSKYAKGRMVGAFEVLGKGWDTTLGGESFDASLVKFMADHFNKEWNKKRDDGQKKDVRVNARAMTKLRLLANKVKHVLSANTDCPVFIEALHDDHNLNFVITRSEFEHACHDLFLEAALPVQAALRSANVTLEQIDSVEMIGGGMRVPKFQEELSKVLGARLELGMHINSDESMALGAAFHGANVSTAFKVRQVGMTDVNPFPIQVSLETIDEVEKRSFLSGLFNKAASKEDIKAEAVDSAEDTTDGPWQKKATLFPTFGKLGIKKTIAFTQHQDVHCSLEYEESEYLPEGTERSIVCFNITGVAEFAKEMMNKGLGKPKVSLQFELDSSGMCNLVKAEVTVEETVMVKEEVEIDDEEDINNTTDITEPINETAVPVETEIKEDNTSRIIEETVTENATSATKEDDKSENKTKKESEKLKKKKKKKTKIIEKEQKKVHRRVLNVVQYHVGKVKPYSTEFLNESKAKLELLAARDKARMMLEESKNNYEAYIYHIKNKLSDEEEAVGKVSTEEQREALLKAAEDASEWLDFEGYEADLETFKVKHAELAVPAEAIFFRLSEAAARPEAVAALRATLIKVEELMTLWETTMPQVTVEERGEVLAKVVEVRAWIDEQEAAQAALKSWDPPAFNSTQVPLQQKPLEKILGKLSKKPKPKPVVVEANGTKAENETVTTTDGNETVTTSDGNETITTDENKAEETDDTSATAENKAKKIEETDETSSTAESEAETDKGTDAVEKNAESVPGDEL